MARKVKPPKIASTTENHVPSKPGARRRMMNTPALTMVEECSRAETGVGATIAPHSQLWNGTWAALVKPAKHIRTMGIR